MPKLVPRNMWFVALRTFVRLCLFLTVIFALQAQEAVHDWQSEARRCAEAQDWNGAFHVVDAVLVRAPKDIEARAWHARLLLWSGRVDDAERKFLSLTGDAPADPDIWQGLASVQARQGLWADALAALDRAVTLAPDRADLRTARVQALRALNRRDEAREEYQRLLKIDSSGAEAKAGLLRLRPRLNHELRTGTETDFFNYTGAYDGEWVSLVSRWTPQWSTFVAADFFQRDGPAAGKFVGSVTRRRRSRWKMR